ncbi:MAG: hypothetical protein U0797_16020 [Gemmataceae bacterium]
MTHLRFVSLAAVLVLVAGLYAVPPEDGELGEPKDKQRQVQQDTEKLLRRVETVIRVLEYNRLGASAQKAMLDEVSKTLAGVSREQMEALLASLEKASAAKGDARTGELKKAGEHHERIVLELKGLLAKFDAVRSLDQAAERFEKLGFDQAEQALSAVQLVVDAEVVAPTDRRRDPIPGRVQRAGSEQTFLSKDFANLVLQVIDLRGKLPEEQKQRAVALVDRVKTKKIAEASYRVIEVYRNSPYHNGRERTLAKAVPAQWDLSEQMLGLSRVLRGPQERLTALRESKRRLDRAIEDQLAVKADTLTPPKLEGGDVNQEAQADLARRAEEEEAARMRFGGRRGGFGFDRRKGEEFLDPTNPAQVHGKQMGDRQGWLEFDTRMTRGTLAPHFAGLAGQLESVEGLMRDSQQGLRRQHKPDEVTPAQDEALTGLREVQAEVVRLLAEEENARTDPLANLKDALARVEQIIRDQKQLREETDKRIERRQNDKLAKDAPRQNELARRTDAVRRDAQAAEPVTRQVLNQAAREMRSAEKSMKAQEGKESLARQEDALEHLEEARRQLEDQLKEAEKRREEIAKLEEAKEKLAELIQQEKQIAEKAEAMAEKPKAEESAKLAQKQGEVTPPTRELGESLKQSVPEAAKSVEAGAKSMDSAKEKLEKTQPKQGEQMARDAVEKLNEAGKALDKALDQKKAEEAAAQAAMQPNRVDPQGATEQIAKALEQTRRAQEAAERAESQADLAERQKQVGEKSPKANAESAKRPAMDASEALKKGEFNKALRQQKDALAKLQDAAKQGDKGKDASDLAQEQQELMDATEQMARSQSATQAAMSAVGQAQAKSPRAVQGQLNKANQQLAKASQSLQKGEAGKAGQAQGEAAEELERLLGTLNEAAVASAKQPGQGKGEGEGMGEGMGEGEGEGMGEGQGKGQGKGKGRQPGQGQGQQQGQAQERENRGQGDRVPDGAAHNDRGAKGDVTGQGAFIHLPPRQREMLRQALTEKLPPEYAAMIQQYFINIAKGKPSPAKK